MTDTLRRAAEQALKALEGELPGWRTPAQERAITALRAALKEPEPINFRRIAADLVKHNQLYQSIAKKPPQPDAKPEPVHPGYIIGSHWLETAYSRIAAGEAEDAVLAEVLGARGWAKREPATREQAREHFGRGTEEQWWEFRDGWKAAEHWHGITKEDK